MKPAPISAISLTAMCFSLYAAGEATTMYPRLSAAIEPAATGNSPGVRGVPQRKSAAQFASEIEFRPDTFGRGVERKPSRSGETPSSTVSFGSDDSDAAFTGVAGREVSSENEKGTVRFAAPDQREATEIRAAFIRPVNGSTLAATQRFEWTEGVSPQGYWLWLGSCFNCTDIADLGLGLSRTYTANLPADSRTIYATLFTIHDGEWYWYDYTFRASSSYGSRAEMISPTYGATLERRQPFAWSRGTAVLEYYLWIGSCQDCTDILDESQGLNLSKSVTLPDDGRTIFVTLFSYVNGEWQWVDYQFRAASPAVNNQVSLTITNRLAWAVNILVNGALVGSVPAFETRTHTDRLSSLQLEWELIGPTLSGRALGDRMGGKFAVVSSPSGEYRYEIDNRVGDSWYFAPYITNRTGTSLLIEVNGGLQSQNRCNCTAPVGSTNVATGYYRLFSNSNVRLWRADSNYTGRYRFWGTDADGRVASGPLPEHVEDKSGILRITATIAP